MNATVASHDRNAVVLGLGITGLSCVRHLHAAGLATTVMDTRAEPPGADALAMAFPDVETHFGALDEARVLQAGLVAVSPGFAADEPLLVRARAIGVDVAGDIELFARAAGADTCTAAITGTNGKSTVTSLLGAILRAAGREVAVGGNLGTPALDLLAEPHRDGFVLELSSFQLDLVDRLDLVCAAILNVTADHLDRHGSMDAYAAAKQRIYAHARCAVFNADDPRTIPPASYAGQRVAVRAERAPGADEWGMARDARGRTMLRGPAGDLLPLDELPMAGRHNGFNVLVALAMAASLGVRIEAALAAVRAFRPLPHRCALVRALAGVRYIDDSKATNIGACRAALEGLDDGDRRLILIAGGIGKGADFAALRPAVAERVRAAVLIGRDAPILERALDGACAVQHAGSMEEAVGAASALASPGDTVLLAPACASFDMFESYAHRGTVFACAVHRLTEGAA
mgnify:CR=1 FL=1